MLPNRFNVFFNKIGLENTFFGEDEE